MVWIVQEPCVLPFLLFSPHFFFFKRRGGKKEGEREALAKPEYPKPHKAVRKPWKPPLREPPPGSVFTFLHAFVCVCERRLCFHSYCLRRSESKRGSKACWDLVSRTARPTELTHASNVASESQPRARVRAHSNRDPQSLCCLPRSLACPPNFLPKC